jgi:ABC-type multidrug transport system permease subunit
VLAYFIAAMSPNLDVANAALPTYVVTLLFFGGFLIRYEDIPNYWKWYSYIDFLKYAWGALMKNQFNGDRNKEVRCRRRLPAPSLPSAYPPLTPPTPPPLVYTKSVCSTPHQHQPTNCAQE